MLNAQLNVQCGNAESDSLQTDIGVPQGDGLSANEFTLYLSNAVYNDKRNDHTYPRTSYVPVNLNSFLNIVMQNIPITILTSTKNTQMTYPLSPQIHTS